MAPDDPTFLRAVERVLADEGGYVSNAADPGGETKFGISKREYPDIDIAALTREDAIAIYRRDYWERFGFAALPGAIAAKTFDLAVNIGPAHAIKCLQRAMRACGQPVTEDGVIGPMTADIAATLEGSVKALTPAATTPLLAALRSEAAGYYRTVAALERGRRPNADHPFLEGWLRRAYE